MGIDIRNAALVGPTRRNDGDDARLRVGNQGDLAVTQLQPPYYEQALRGNCFVYSMSTAASIVAVGTAGFPNLWNPLGSGKLIVINKITWQAAAIGTPVISGFQYAFLPNAGAQVGTASPVLTGAYSNTVGVFNLLLGNGNASIAKYLGAAGTMTTAPTIFASTGLNLGATATQTPWSGVDNIDGRIVIPPSVLFQIGASTATSTTFNISIWGMEIPIPLTI
jgi:hypothetical protein